MQDSTVPPDLVKHVMDAVGRGFQVIPLAPQSKTPKMASWPHFRWPDDADEDDVRRQLEEWSANVTAGDHINLGVSLGEPSRRLVDIDLDHYRTARLKDFFLPPTPAKSGRPGKPNSHYWYLVEEGTLVGTRQHKMPRTQQPDGSMKMGPVIVEYRSTGAQTMFPPSIWRDKETGKTEQTSWFGGRPWGGKKGPAVVHGRRLAVQVALLGLCSVLLEYWPSSGSRHEAYLALAGGLLRYGDSGVHPYWEQNASVLIRALAEATLDEDGPDARESESIRSTIDGLNAGKPVTGFGKLSELLGDEAVKQIRILIGEVESAAGVTAIQPALPQLDLDDQRASRDELVGSLKTEERDPLGERLGSWEPLDLEPYLSGQVRPVLPSVMQRDDGEYLFYPGRVNMLYGSSESAKSWLALYTSLQVMSTGQRVMYLDFEDDPENTLERLRLMGAGTDDLRFLFSYVRPEDPLASMQRDRWGGTHISPAGQANQDLFNAAMDSVDPALIVLDGMTVLYGLHGLDSNDAVSTDIITGWAKKLTRNGKSTVIIIDHTGKGSERGSTPIGSQHKQAMVQGTMIQVWPTQQPMPGAVGEVELIVLKDRPGQVRKISVKSGGKAQLAAQVRIDSTVPNITTVQIMAPPDPNSPQVSAKRQADIVKKQRYEAEEALVLSLYGDQLGKSFLKVELMKALGVEDLPGDDQPAERKKWEATLDRLMDQGWLYTEGRTRGTRYTLAMSVSDPNGLDIDLTGQPD